MPASSSPPSPPTSSISVAQICSRSSSGRSTPGTKAPAWPPPARRWTACEVGGPPGSSTLTTVTVWWLRPTTLATCRPPTRRSVTAHVRAEHHRLADLLPVPGGEVRVELRADAGHGRRPHRRRPQQPAVGLAAPRAEVGMVAGDSLRGVKDLLAHDGRHRALDPFLGR